MKTDVLLKALEAYKDYDVCVIEKTPPLSYNDSIHHKVVNVNVFAIKDGRIILSKDEIRID